MTVAIFSVFLIMCGMMGDGTGASKQHAPKPEPSPIVQKQTQPQYVWPDAKTKK